MLLAVGWNVAIRTKFEREIVIAFAPGNGRADRNILNTGQFADAPRCFPVKLHDLAGVFSLVHHGHVDCEHLAHFERRLSGLQRKEGLYERAGRRYKDERGGDLDDREDSQFPIRDPGDASASAR